MEIRKIMERETAQKQLEEIKLKICGVDVDALCEDETVKDSIEKLPDDLMRSLENAVMLGLVSWDEEKNCLVQKFIKTLKSGEQSADQVDYEHEVTINKIKKNKSDTQLEALLKVMSIMTGKSEHLLGQLSGQDVQISMACINFFGM